MGASSVADPAQEQGWVDLMEARDTRYARTPDGVNIAYQVAGDGPIDLAWGFDFFGNVDLAWEQS